VKTAPAPRAVTPDAVIEAAEIGAAHDGRAELVVSLRFPGGGLARVPLATEAGLELMRRCGVEQASQLRGHSWRTILETLECWI
jgi:hypothetical protein